MSASEGGGGHGKANIVRGGCVNFILQISSKCGLGKGVIKSEILADVINGSSLMSFRTECTTNGTAAIPRIRKKGFLTAASAGQTLRRKERYRSCP